MDYEEEIEKGLSRIPEARIRKSIAPLIETMKSEIVTELEKNKVTVEQVDVDALTKSITLTITKSIVTKEDIHSLVHKSVSNFVDLIPQPQEQIEKDAIIAPILKAVEAAKNLVVIPTSSILEYRPHDQDDKGKVYRFYGFVRADGAWYIVRDDSTEVQQRYAAGDGDYQLAWDKRDKLKYGYISEVL